MAGSAALAQVATHGIAWTPWPATRRGRRAQALEKSGADASNRASPGPEPVELPSVCHWNGYWPSPSLIIAIARFLIGEIPAEEREKVKSEFRRDLAQRPFEEKIRMVGELIRLSRNVKAQRVREPAENHLQSADR